MTNTPSMPADRIVTACEERRQAVVEVLRLAKRRITLSLFRCTDKAIFSELAAAVKRGVVVEVLATSRARGGKKKLKQLWNKLEATGATIATYNDPVVKYHAKYLVVDDGPALIASLNFTRKCFSRTNDAIVITHDRAVVDGLRALMMADRDERPLPSGLPARLIVGPELARRQFTELIETASARVQLIDPKVSDPALLALLSARRKQGLRVDIHGDPHLAGMKSHGKIMLIDGKRAVVGSMALTALCLDFRREVAVVVDEPAAVAGIQKLFTSIDAAAGVPSSATASVAGGTLC
ncbi:MAG: phospholipase D-like domain-containing protein [Vicinamibacterales bacterium]